MPRAICTTGGREADSKEFAQRAACVADEYSSFAVAPGVHINGKLTLGENTADNGGARIALMALMDSLAGKTAPKIDGFTPEQRFFLVLRPGLVRQPARGSAAPASPDRPALPGQVSGQRRGGEYARVPESLLVQARRRPWRNSPPAASGNGRRPAICVRSVGHVAPAACTPRHRCARSRCCSPPLSLAAARIPGRWSIAEEERFLLTARIGGESSAGKGITDSKKAMLTDGRRSHAAHIQWIDIYMPLFKGKDGSEEREFKDTWKFNVAAWRLAKLLHLTDMMPPSVQRTVDGKPASVTWWLDGIAMDEKERLAKRHQAARCGCLESPDGHHPHLRPVDLQHGSQPGEPAHRERLARLHDRPHPRLSQMAAASQPGRRHAL